MMLAWPIPWWTGGSGPVSWSSVWKAEPVLLQNCTFFFSGFGLAQKGASGNIPKLGYIWGDLLNVQ